MKRSKWKGPFTVCDLKQSITKHKNSVITPIMVGKTIQVYNGKDYQELVINENMVGYKIGSFLMTRTNFNYKKK